MAAPLQGVTKDDRQKNGDGCDTGSWGTRRVKNERKRKMNEDRSNTKEETIKNTIREYIGTKT